MATTNKDFKIRNGLIVEGANATVNGNTVLTNAASINALSDVAISSPTSGQVLKWNGSAWINDTDATGGGGGGGTLSNIVEDTTPQLGGDLDAQNFDITNLNSVTLTTSPTSPGTGAGTIFWDSGDGIAKAVLNANVTIGLSQESIIKVKNATGSTVTKGSVVYINGAQGQMPTIALADADTEATSSKTFGFAAEAIADGAEGFVITEGVFRGANTATLTEGGALYLSTTAGEYTQTIPAEPAHMVFLGYVVKAHGSAGEIIVKIQNGYELTELHGVVIDSTPANNEVLAYDTTSGLWINQTAEEAGVANLSGATFTGNIAGTNASFTGNVNAVTVNATTFTGNTSGWATQVKTTSKMSTGGDANVAFYPTFVDANNVTPTAEDVWTDSGLLYYPLTNTLQASAFSGSGAQLTSIPNSATTATDANGASTIVSRDATGNFTANVITATTFNGSGTGLTSIPAANISGTVAVANGGTGATTATDARTNLETPKVYTQATQPTGGNVGDIWIDTDSTPAPSVLFARFEATKVATNQNITNTNTFNDIVTFPTATVENVGGFSISSGSITMPLTGRYSITINITWANNTVGRRQVAIYKDSTELWRLRSAVDSTAGSFQQHMSVASERFTSGNVLSIRVEQNSGGTLAIPDARIVVEYLGE